MRRRWNKIMALLLASAMLTANVGMVSTFAAGNEKMEQDAQKGESEEKTSSDDKKKDEEKTNQTAAPTANVKEGTYSAAQKITLKSTSKDAVIYYTTDGKEPTEKSTRFDAKKPVEIKVTTTVKAIAVSKETGKSKVVSFTYKIGESIDKAEDKETPEETKNAEPTTTPEQTPTAEPTEIPEKAQTQSERGEAQLMPASETEEKVGETAIESVSMIQEIDAVEDMELTELDKKEVQVASEEFTVEEVKWQNAEDTSETKFKAGKKYKVTLTLKAKEGFQFSGTTKAVFNGIEGVCDSFEKDKGVYTFTVTAPAAPEITPKSADLGGFTEGTDTVELKYAGEDGAKLEYSLDKGVTWKEYAAEEKIALSSDQDGTCTVTARAVKNNISVKVSDEYKVKVIKPAADVAPGTYEESQTIKLSSATEGAKIYYTEDGTDPTNESKLYESPITLTKTTTIKAIAYKDSDASTISEFKYEIKEKEPEPVPEVKKITNIEILELDKPSRGAKPDRKVKVSSESHATVEVVKWLKDNEGDDIEGVFKASKSQTDKTAYYAYIYLKAKDGYEFDTNIFISGANTENIKVSNYSLNPHVKSVSPKDLIVCVAWNTQVLSPASATQNTITGIQSSYNKGTQGAIVTFTMNGANNSAEEGNERYVPVKYQVSTTSGEIKDNKTSVTKSLRFSTAGTYTLTVTFQKQVYDAEISDWKNVDGVTDTKTATVKINATATATPTAKPTATPTPTTTSSSTTDSTSSKSKNAKTGDETPIAAIATVFVLAGAAIVVLVARKRKSQK